MLQLKNKAPQFYLQFSLPYNDPNVVTAYKVVEITQHKHKHLEIVSQDVVVGPYLSLLQVANYVCYANLQLQQLQEYHVVELYVTKDAYAVVGVNETTIKVVFGADSSWFEQDPIVWYSYYSENLDILHKEHAISYN